MTQGDSSADAQPADCRNTNRQRGHAERAIHPGVPAQLACSLVKNELADNSAKYDSLKKGQFRHGAEFVLATRSEPFRTGGQAAIQAKSQGRQLH